MVWWLRSLSDARRSRVRLYLGKRLFLELFKSSFVKKRVKTASVNSPEFEPANCRVRALSIDHST
jgi:hypothetical protein